MKKVFLILVAFLILINQARTQWFIQYSSNPSQSIYCLKFYNEMTGYHSGVLYNSSTFNIYKTTNGGINYISQNSNYTAQRFMSIFIISPDTVLISGNYGKILRTTNGGLNWVTQYSDTTLQFWGLYFTNSLTGYVVGSYGTIMKTTNGGINWSPLITNVQTALDGIWFVNENTGYVGGANVVLKTTNAGLNWINVYGSFISPFETATAFYFSNVNTGLYCTNAGRIVKTTNGGANWILVHSINGGIWGMSFVNSDTGYCCTSTGKILKTTNAGELWGEQNTPLNENLYEIHFPTALTGYVASWSGKILKTTNGGLTFISRLNEPIVKNYILEQNYPNPFNSYTSIVFSIPENKQVSLQIYDLTGKKVLTLVNSFLIAGKYEISFNAENLSSGVYYYKLLTSDKLLVKKLVLIK